MHVDRMKAMRFERPVVASEVGGIVDIVRHDQNGWLVPERDAWALATILERLHARPAVARAVGVEARADVAQRFAWSTIVNSTNHVYRAAVDARRA